MMLQLLCSAKWIKPLYTHRGFPAINGTFRLMSDKCKKDGDKPNIKELACGKKSESKSEKAACGCKKPCKCEPTCPCKKKKCPTHGGGGHHSAGFWKKISLMGCIPVIVLLTFIVFGSHHEHERPEFILWPHMYKRSKPFFFNGGPGNKSYYHNPHVNPLPPLGYEDEIDAGANGQPEETDQEREQRLKEFEELRKEWKKKDDNREKEAAKLAKEVEMEMKRQKKAEEALMKAEAKQRAKEMKLEEKQRKAELKEQAKQLRMQEKMKKSAEEVKFIPLDEDSDRIPSD